ncbi:glutaminyl-peptide cyclotransferase [Pseudonocardia spinosispora]|uniref:glutaminyl-peptide cyclotransferase n=1 Tax=Pseudonocardia spinosispora TaxID=103441 RepID=UPI000A035EC3|nr:glutaminyl-peptide cyclotransferase [Pseudonocardia spinosispora]
MDTVFRIRRAPVLFAAILIALGAVAVGCASRPSTASTEAATAGIPVLHPTVVATLDHDTQAWTEGLEIADGVLYESTGLTGRSELRKLDPNTGAVLHRTPLPTNLYGEGITVLGDRIWQLTYRNEVALRWTGDAVNSPVPYPGEGWGLCHTDTGRLIASDGTDRLRLLSPDDLAQVGSIAVTIHGRALSGFNELDCGGGNTVLANIYPTGWLAQISLPDGKVTALVDATRLLPPDLPRSTDVLNGIAAIPGTDQFLLTGKLWPHMYRVRFAQG